MREYAQLYLRIVCVYQYAVFPAWDEVAAEASAELGSYRNVLQIRLCRGEPSGSGYVLLEARVDDTVRVCCIYKPDGIGGVQLCRPAVIEYKIYYRAVRAQLFEYVGGGGISALGLFQCGKSELLKQHRAELLW